MEISPEDALFGARIKQLFEAKEMQESVVAIIESCLKKALRNKKCDYFIAFQIEDSSGHFSDSHRLFFRDTFLGITLWRRSPPDDSAADHFPVAHLGFTFPVRPKNTLCIMQIQGVDLKRAKDYRMWTESFIKRAVGRIRWEEALLTVAAKVGEAVGMEKLAILPARKNLYFDDTELSRLSEKALARNQRLFDRYDRNAIRLGMETDPSFQLYVRPL